MTPSRLLCILVLTTVVMLTAQLSVRGQQPSRDEYRGQQRIVYLLKDGRSKLLVGDEDRRRRGDLAYNVMPELLASGWQIGNIVPTHATADQADQVIAIVVVVRTGQVGHR